MIRRAMHRKTSNSVSGREKIWRQRGRKRGVVGNRQLAVSSFAQALVRPLKGDIIG